MIAYPDIPKFTFLGDTVATLLDMGVYTQNTGTSVWTLPSIASSQTFFKTPKIYFCKNMGTGTVTLTPASGDFFNVNGNAAQTTYVLQPRQGVTIFEDGTYWHALTEIPPAIYGWVGSMFTQIQQVTVANTATETTLLGTGVGTITVPANFLSVGKTIRIQGMGFCSRTAAPTLNINLYLVSTVIASTGAVTPSNVTNGIFEINALVTTETTGSTGTVQSQGIYQEGGANAFGMVNTAAITINTTSSQALNLTATWGTANAGNTITLSTVAINVLN